MNAVQNTPWEVEVDMGVLRELSEMTGNPIREFMDDLGISESPCSSIDAAILRYHMAQQNNDPEERLNMLTEWTRFSLEDTARAETIEEIKRVLNLAPPTDARNAAIEKHEQLSSKEIEEASTIEELWEAYYNAPQGGPAQYVAFQKLDEIVSRQADDIDTLEEAKKMHAIAPKGSNSQRKVLGIWVAFCTQLSELREAYDASLNGPDEQEVLKQLNKQATEEIEGAKVVLVIQKIRNYLPQASIVVRKKLSQKMYNLHVAFREKERAAKKN